MNFGRVFVALAVRDRNRDGRSSVSNRHSFPSRSIKHLPPSQPAHISMAKGPSTLLDGSFCAFGKAGAPSQVH
jgi:hypothetical protein